jgi:hypothetical protein
VADQLEEWRRNRDEFFKEMGHCIALWAEADEALFHIFRVCVGPYDQSAIIYYRTPGLDLRLGLTDEIVVATLRPGGGRSNKRDPRVAVWKLIVKEFKNLLAVRRRIAHQPVRTEPFSVGSAIDDPQTSFEIFANRHEQLRDRERKLPPLDIRRLTLHHLGVEGLRQKLAEFREGVLTKPPEAPLPPALQPGSHDPRQTGRAPARPRRRRSSPPSDTDPSS